MTNAERCEMIETDLALVAACRSRRALISRIARSKRHLDPEDDDYVSCGQREPMSQNPNALDDEIPVGESEEVCRLRFELAALEAQIAAAVSDYILSAEHVVPKAATALTALPARRLTTE